MEEICPICSDVLSEISSMYEEPFTLLGDVSGRVLSEARFDLAAQYMPETLAHFYAAWVAVQDEGSPSPHGSSGRVLGLHEYRVWLDSLPRSK